MATRTLKVDLPAEIFDVEVNIPLIHQVVVAQQAAARQGTASTKRRGEVRGGGRKPYKQKGTGRARQGSTRAPQFAGGGVVHGPKPRDYDQRTPKKMKAAALRGALSDRAREGRIHVVDSLVSGERPSTRSALAALAGLTDRVRYLVVLERTDAVTWLSLRNAQQVHIVAVDQLNTYDVLASDDVVFTQGAYDAFVSKAPTSSERPVSRITPVAEAPAAPAVTEPVAVADVDTDVEAAEGVDTEVVETETVETEAKPELPKGAKAPLKSGNAPKGYEVKAAAGTYYAPDAAGYADADAEFWFKSVEDAEAAGLTAGDEEGDK